MKSLKSTLLCFLLISLLVPVAPVSADQAPQLAEEQSEEEGSF